MKQYAPLMAISVLSVIRRHRRLW